MLGKVKPSLLIRGMNMRCRTEMITLRACSGKQFVLNCELIYKIEREFDTIITLTDQKTLRVENTPDEIIEKVAEFKRSIYRKETEEETR